MLALEKFPAAIRVVLNPYSSAVTDDRTSRARKPLQRNQKYLCVFCLFCVSAHGQTLCTLRIQAPATTAQPPAKQHEHRTNPRRTNTL